MTSSGGLLHREFQFSKDGEASLKKVLYFVAKTELLIIF